MQARKKYFLVAILIVLLASPVTRIFSYIFPITIAPLRGHIVLAEKPVFTWERWFNSEYQTEYNNYLEDHLGLRNVYVRIYNQLDFSLFNIGHASGVIIGKDHYLYERKYIDAYAGKDFLGDEFIEDKCEKISYIQDAVSDIGIELLIVFPPGKASFFPEYIPEQYLEEGISITNREAYVNSFKEKGIRHIDFSTYFNDIRDTSYPLYHKCGIHWNQYGTYIALDSIINFVEAAKGIDMVDMSIEGIELSRRPRLTDYDVGDALNLIFRIPDKPMPYPYGYTYDTIGKKQLNLMVIADSYYWNIFRLPGIEDLWGKHHFRYYNRQTWTLDMQERPSTQLSIEELSTFDVLLVLYTEANMTQFADGLFGTLYGLFQYRDRLASIENKIRRTPEWMESVIRKASERGISTEEMLRKDAMWILQNELEKE